MKPPLLAATLKDLDTQLKSYPLLMSPKLDGIRCLVSGGPFTRNLKPVRNKHIARLLSHPALEGMDGELIVGPPNKGQVYNRTNSGVMSADGEPDFKFYVFDTFNAVGLTFTERLLLVQSAVSRYHKETGSLCVAYVPHSLARSPLQVRDYEDRQLKAGYEGIMLRSPEGLYKHGRSTPREGILWKLKRFTDDEVTVVRLEEAEANTNPAVRNALGHLERSTHKAGKVGKQMLGTLVCRTAQGEEVRVGPGTLSHADRARYWAAPETLLGRKIVRRSFNYGVKDAARFSLFHGFREDLE